MRTPCRLRGAHSRNGRPVRTFPRTLLSRLIGWRARTRHHAVDQPHRSPTAPSSIAHLVSSRTGTSLHTIDHAAQRAQALPDVPPCVVGRCQRCGAYWVIGADQSRPRTVSKAASTLYCSSGVRWPARSPRRWRSTAPTCLTSMRVAVPPMSISDRNDADVALVDGGATRTTERGRKAVILERWGSSSIPGVPCPNEAAVKTTGCRETSPTTPLLPHKRRHRRDLGGGTDPSSRRYRSCG